MDSAGLTDVSMQIVTDGEHPFNFEKKVGRESNSSGIISNNQDKKGCRYSYLKK